MLDSPEAQFAIEAVREASLLARRIQREMVTGALTKDDRSPVTVADFAVQALVARRLAEQLPGSTLIGEEQCRCPAARRRHRDARSDHRLRSLRDSRCHAGRSLQSHRPRQRRAAAKPFGRSIRSTARRAFLRREQYAVALGLSSRRQSGAWRAGLPGADSISWRLRLDVAAVRVAAGQGTWLAAA